MKERRGNVVRTEGRKRKGILYGKRKKKRRTREEEEERHAEVCRKGGGRRMEGGRREWVIRWEGRRGREKFLDQINAFRGAGDRDHALSSSLPAAFLRLFEVQRRGERKTTHTSLLSQT